VRRLDQKKAARVKLVSRDRDARPTAWRSYRNVCSWSEFRTRHQELHQHRSQRASEIGAARPWTSPRTAADSGSSRTRASRSGGRTIVTEVARIFALLGFLGRPRSGDTHKVTEWP